MSDLTCSFTHDCKQCAESVATYKANTLIYENMREAFFKKDYNEFVENARRINYCVLTEAQTKEMFTTITTTEDVGEYFDYLLPRLGMPLSKAVGYSQYVATYHTLARLKAFIQQYPHETKDLERLLEKLYDLKLHVMRTYVKELIIARGARANALETEEQRLRRLLANANARIAELEAKNA